MSSHARDHSDGSRLARRPDDDLLRSIDRAIERHAADPTVSVPQIARALRASPSLISHRLGASGCGFRLRLHRARIRKAKELLDGTTSSLKAIGLTVGYRHAQDFSRWFRRLVGTTPSTYRRRQATQEPESDPDGGGVDPDRQQWDRPTSVMERQPIQASPFSTSRMKQSS